MNLHILECSWRFMNLHPLQFVHGLLLVHEYSWILFHELNSWLHECPIISSWVVHELFMSWSQLVQEYNSWIFLNCSWSIPNHLAGVFININDPSVDTVKFPECDPTFWITTLWFSESVSPLSETDDVTMHQRNVFVESIYCVHQKWFHCMFVFLIYLKHIDLIIFTFPESFLSYFLWNWHCI